MYFCRRTVYKQAVMAKMCFFSLCNCAT